MRGKALAGLWAKAGTCTKKNSNKASTVMNSIIEKK
jgi:hypothetical protein